MNIYLKWQNKGKLTVIVITMFTALCEVAEIVFQGRKVEQMQIHEVLPTGGNVHCIAWNQPTVAEG